MGRNAVEVTIAAEQSVRVIQPAESQAVSVVMPASQEVRVPVAASQEVAVVIPISQAVNVICEDSENAVPIYSGYGVAAAGRNKVVASWDSDIAVTTRARHKKNDGIDWVYTDERGVYENAHSRTLNDTFVEGDTCEWQGGGQNVGGAWYWSDSQMFSIEKDGGGVVPQV
jgi:hypothetical protein